MQTIWIKVSKRMPMRHYAYFIKPPGMDNKHTVSTDHDYLEVVKKMDYLEMEKRALAAEAELATTKAPTKPPIAQQEDAEDGYF